MLCTQTSKVDRTGSLALTSQDKFKSLSVQMDDHIR